MYNMYMYLTLERTANAQLNLECACVQVLCAVIIRLRSNKWESYDNWRNQARIRKLFYWHCHCVIKYQVNYSRSAACQVDAKSKLI